MPRTIPSSAPAIAPGRRRAPPATAGPGPRLHAPPVPASSILGGQTMVVYAADYSLLGSGDRPWTPERSAADATFLDVVDVADLDSERTHAYELLGAADGEEILTHSVSPDGRD